MEKNLVCDTGTLLSLKLVKKDFPFIDLARFNFVISPAVEKELEDFAQHDDLLGNFAKEILKENLIIKKEEKGKIEELKKTLGVSGKQRITETDLSVFLIAKEGKLPFFTDDFSVLIHLSSFYPQEKIFHGIALIAELLSEKLTKGEIYNYVFNQFIPKRWKNISEQRIIDIETILSGVLE